MGWSLLLAILHKSDHIMTRAMPINQLK